MGLVNVQTNESVSSSSKKEKVAGWGNVYIEHNGKKRKVSANGVPLYMSNIISRQIVEFLKAGGNPEELNISIEFHLTEDESELDLGLLPKK